MPPQVIATIPSGMSQLEDVGDEVVITFNERISERPSTGTFDQAVVVSPEVPDLQVGHRSDGITLKAPGGWRAQQVYRVRVLPVIQDLFQNRMVAPFELVFGTGMGFSESAIAGVVNDRITGEPVTGVRVTARQIGAGGDSPLFFSPTDSLGIYAMRWMTQGDYELLAFTDVNRNREADPFELIGEGRAALGRRDTTIVNLTILRPDTTPPVVGRVEVADSATLKVTLDDFLAQEEPLNGVSVVLRSDSATAPAVAGVIHDGAYQDTVQARLEVSRAAAAAADTTAEGAEGAEGVEGVEVGEAAAQEGVPASPSDEVEAASGPAPLLPKQEFYILLADSLYFDVAYVVQIDGITNINGVGPGAGTDTIVRVAPPPPPDSAATDSTATDSTSTDSTAVDSTGVAVDSARVEIQPDTAQAPPDTMRVSGRARRGGRR